MREIHIKKLAHICLITEDVPTLAAFYEHILGVKAEIDGDFATFGSSGLRLDLYSRQGTEAMAPGSTAGMGHGGFTLDVEVEDVDAAFAQLQAEHIPVVKPPQTYPWGSRSVWLRDPDGNLVNFFCAI